uniref:Uncharacterized protein 16 n=1 Tax=Halisarca dujardinii TaxID=2583056 RepID=A0AA96MN23_HALDU|nr:uncharacterized protein 16 [Halisarca dujardinii]
MSMILGKLLLIALAAMCSALPATDETRLHLSRSRRSTDYKFYYPDDNVCCPKVLPATDKSTSSVVQAFGGCQVQVAAITAFGSCNIKHEGFWWFIDWGNGEHDEGCTNDLGPFGPRVHQYKSCLKYHGLGYKGSTECVEVYYCSSPDSGHNKCTSNADCCDSFTHCIDVHY